MVRQIKQARGFRQFLLRGFEKVRAEWAIVCPEAESVRSVADRHGNSLKGVTKRGFAPPTRLQLPPAWPTSPRHDNLDRLLAARRTPERAS